MSERYVCDNHDRRADLIAAGFEAHDGTPLNAIDFLEVVDGVLDEAVTLTPDDDPRQFVLLLRFHTEDGLAALDQHHVSIRGGTTITAIETLSARPLSTGPWPAIAARSPILHDFLTDRAAELGASEAARWLFVIVDRRGDHSRYTLRLVDGVGSEQTPAHFDPVLTEVSFLFKVECPTGFDCEDEVDCPPDDPTAPPIDYLARDYQSFRRLMLDRMSVSLPHWRERNLADMGVMLVELLAYNADRAAYLQDAVGTEAYLNTARLRTSVRRHARLLDYQVHEGCNARAWVQLILADGQEVTGGAVERGARFLTAVPNKAAVISTNHATEAMSPSPTPGGIRPAPEVFEALHPLEELSWRHNEIHLFTYGETRCVLPAGATRAALRTADGAGALTLARGDVLVLEEVRHPETGATADADLKRRHAVRLISVSEERIDVLYGTSYWEVRWHEEDALLFPMCLWHVTVEDDPLPVTVARGNIVLVDHGATRRNEALIPSKVPLDGRYRPRVERENVVSTVGYDHEAVAEAAVSPDPALAATLPSAHSSLEQDPRAALAALTLTQGDDLWVPVRELLGSDAFARELVVEMEEDGRAYIRFGDGVLGRRPPAGAQFAATYRTGGGARGNVGAEAIRHLLSDSLAGAVTAVRNPLAASGGVDPEALQSIKLQAPEAFKVQMRAVTTEDWAEVSARHPDVQRAVARIRWTGSWNTVFLTVDPVAGRDFEALRDELLEFLEPFRLAGIDLELRPPTYVPIDLRLVMCVRDDHFAHEVQAAAQRALSSRDNSDGTRGWFHPDNLSFGQPVYLSPIVARLMKIPGVAWVDLDPISNGSDQVRFQRLDKVPAGELEAGVMPVGKLEVARLDNDPNAPDRGMLRLTTRGGR